MVGPEKDKILKFWEEQGVGKALDEIRKRHHETVECFVVELLRHHAFHNARPDDIKLEITTSMGSDPFTVKVTYSVKLERNSR